MSKSAPKARINRNIMAPRRESATLSTPTRDTTVKVKLRPGAIIELTVYRHGKLVRHRELGPQVDYDD